jgi:hypothetical protein
MIVPETWKIPLVFPLFQTTLYTHLWKDLHFEDKKNKATKAPRHEGTQRAL